jgi:hypothetical protein
MPTEILPASFVGLVEQFAPVFTAPSFASFRVLVAGWVHALGMHRISDVIRSAGALAQKHFSSYYRFFSAGRWCLDELGLTLFSLIVTVLRLKEVELVLDDTLSRHKGKKIALATMHADPLLRRGRKMFHSHGHVFVVLAVHVTAPALAITGWALPFLFRLFESSRHGGRADAPSDQGRKAARRRRGAERRTRERLTDREVVDGQVVPCEPRRDSGPLPENVRPTKLQLATELVLLVARRFPHLRFRVLADHAYNGHALLHEVLSQVANVSFAVRGHKGAALYELPPARRSGQHGRPRTKGARLPTPEAWAARHPRAFHKVEVEMYGKIVPLLVASYLGMAYRTLPGRLVRYVITKDPRGAYRTDYLMSTDLDLSAAEVVAAYSHRWPLELTCQETKQKLGLEDPQTQLPASVRRTAPMAFITYSLVVLWYITAGRLEQRKLSLHHDAWYDKTGRPSFTEMRAALRRLGWRRTLLDPAQPLTARSKSLVRYLEVVAAAA